MSEFFQKQIDELQDAIAQAPDHPLIRRAGVALAQAQALIDNGLVSTDGTTPKVNTFAFAAHLENARRAWLMAVNEPILVKEHKRRANLPTAEKRYTRWRELADEIRRAKPYIKSKTEIARMVRRQLKNSHDPDDAEFIKSVEAIRRQI